MTLEEFKEEFYSKLEEWVAEERANAGTAPGTPNVLPKDTGRLSQELFKLDRTADGFKIWIDTSSWQYPIWINQVGYRTAGYWEIVVDRIINKIINEYGGQIA